MDKKIKDVIRVGNSASVILDKELLYKMEVKVGDKLEVTNCKKNQVTFKKLKEELEQNL